MTDYQPTTNNQKGNKMIILNFEEVAAQAAKHGYTSYTMEVRTYRADGYDDEGIFFIVGSAKAEQYFQNNTGSVSGLINKARKEIAAAKAAISNINDPRIEEYVFVYDAYGNISGKKQNPLFDAVADAAAVATMEEIKKGIDAAFKIKWEDVDVVVENIANLTQHKASQEQIDSGVVDVDFDELSKLLTFDAPPSKVTMVTRATKIARFASSNGFKAAMIGGAPYFMSTLEKALIDAGIKPVYAFSERVSVEVDGVKTSIFKHGGFVTVV